MKMYGGIHFDENGLSNSIRGMHLQTTILNTITDNITGFNKVGYQRKESVVSSFSEIVGIHGVSEVNDTTPGRISSTGNPLDFALPDESYFQYKTPEGIKLTKDGRFKLDKDGNLLTLENYKVLDTDGNPVQFKHIPERLEDIKVSQDGNIKVLNRATLKQIDCGHISVVSENGSSVKKPDIRQGFVESSNVSLQKEVFDIVPIRRNFEANRQLFIIQNDELTKTIQELGRSS